MKWTRTPPSTAGYYWFRVNARTKEEDKEIVYIGGENAVDWSQYLGRCGHEELDTEDWLRRSGCWFGPRVQIIEEEGGEQLLEAIEAFSDELINMALVPGGPCIITSVLDNSDLILEACSKIR